MRKKCAICHNNMQGESGKLKGTMIKIKENSKTNLIYVCSKCEKQKDWMEKAVIKAA